MWKFREGFSEDRKKASESKDKLLPSNDISSDRVSRNKDISSASIPMAKKRKKATEKGSKGRYLLQEETSNSPISSDKLFTLVSDLENSISLIEKGRKNVKFKDKDGNNMLHLILPKFVNIESYVKLVCLLMQKGVSLFEPNDEGKTPFDVLPSVEAKLQLQHIISNNIAKAI